MTKPNQQLGDRALQILRDLAMFNSTSYWEQEVTDYLYETANTAGLEVSVDQFGNITAEKPGTNHGAPGIAFVAHTDHPGYEVVDQNGQNLTLTALGGLGRHAGDSGTPIRIISNDGTVISAVVTGCDEPADEYSKQRRTEGWLGTQTVYARLEAGVDLGELPVRVVLELPDITIDDDLISMRAADDLAGCAATLAGVESLVGVETEGSVFGVFTRAEEVGLLGAAANAEAEILPKNTVVVSVETSSILPGADQGRGVVIRTGDRAATFDYFAEAYLVAAASELSRKDESFKFQRQLMSAGGCEASAYKAFGYRVTGTAFPLGNWHNRGDGKVDLENISKSDFISGTKLIREAGSLAGTEQPGILSRFTGIGGEESDRLKATRIDR